MTHADRAAPSIALALLAAAAFACSPPDTQADDDDTTDAAPGGPDAGPTGDVDAGPGDPDAAPIDTDCEATFRLPGYAEATAVAVTGSFTDPPWAATAADGAEPLARSGDGWQTTIELAPGTYSYKFVVDGTTWVADPANPDTEDDGYGGVNSLYTCGGAGGTCGDPDAFDWRDTVMYFVMVDRFFDSDNASNPVANVSSTDAYGNSGQYLGGDLAGVRAKVPYLADLGVTAIWLSAPYENRNYEGAAIDSADPHTYSGYHGYWPSPANVDYTNPYDPSPRPQVESRIGDEDDLRGFIDDAHGAVSANGDGIKVLFDYVMKHVDVASGLYAAHWDWFTRNESNQFVLCGPSNLWNDPYWGTRCAFTGYLAPLDMYNDAARAWSVDDAMWWATEYGIDGYRLDAIKHVPLSWLTDLRARLNSEIEGAAGDRFYLVGETFDYFDRNLLKQFVEPETMLDGQFDFPFKRQLCEAVFNPSGSLQGFADFMAGNDGYYDPAAGPGAIMTTWIGNHDIPRAIHFASWQLGNCTEGSHTGNGWTGNFSQPGDAAPYQRLALAFAIMMTNPGIPLIYYGDEIGLAGGGDPGNRHMMPWSDSQLNDHQKQLRATVRKLARLRGEKKVLGRGTRQTLQATQDVWVYRMSGCGAGFDDVVVAVNRADDSRQVTLPSGSYTDVIGETEVDGGARTLPARSFLVLVPR
jgi:glycosidase